jgi:hypothetical protein
MRIRNKKGAVILLSQQVAVGVAIATVVALPFMTPRFRRQKTVEHCVSVGNSEQGCKDMVKGMSKKEIKSYYEANIRDSKEIGNKGNF